MCKEKVKEWWHVKIDEIKGKIAENMKRKCSVEANKAEVSKTQRS